MLKKEVPPEQWCTPKNAKELDCTRCLLGIESNVCLSFLRRYRRDRYPMTEKNPAMNSSDSDNADSDVTIAPTKNQPLKDKVKESSDTKTSKKAPRTYNDNIKGVEFFQDVLNQFLPSTFMVNFKSDEKDVVAAGLTAAGVLMMSVGLMLKNKKDGK